MPTHTDADGITYLTEEEEARLVELGEISARMFALVRGVLAEQLEVSYRAEARAVHVDDETFEAMDDAQPQLRTVTMRLLTLADLIQRAYGSMAGALTYEEAGLGDPDAIAAELNRQAKAAAGR